MNNKCLYREMALAKEWKVWIVAIYNKEVLVELLPSEHRVDAYLPFIYENKIVKARI